MIDSDRPSHRRFLHRRSREADILELLRDAGHPVAGPGRELTVEEEERTTEAAASALTRILASPRDPTPAPLEATAFAPVRRWLTLRAVTVIGVALACSLMLAVVILNPSQQTQQGPGRRDPDIVANGVTPPLPDFTLISHHGDFVGTFADDALRNLARAAAVQPLAGAEGTVQHVRLTGWFLTQDAPSMSSLVPTVTDNYYLPDGRFRTIEARGEPLDGYGRVVNPAPVSPATIDETFPGPKEGVGYADDLPTDPTRLRDRLIPDRAECPIVAECLTSQIVKLHYTWVLSPKLVSGLWSTLVDEPGVTYLGHTTDRLGRPAVGFATPTSDGHRGTVLYADPATGAFLGSEEILLEREPGDGLPDGVKAPVVVTFVALAEVGTVSDFDAPARRD